MTHSLAGATSATLCATGLIFLLALLVGIWKYRQMTASSDHLAHPHADIAHLSALLHPFATSAPSATPTTSSATPAAAST